MFLCTQSCKLAPRLMMHSLSACKYSSGCSGCFQKERCPQIACLSPNRSLAHSASLQKRAPHPSRTHALGCSVISSSALRAGQWQCRCISLIEPLMRDFLSSLPLNVDKQTASHSGAFLLVVTHTVSDYSLCDLIKRHL